ncbi:MAG: TPM domain-containing protein [Bacteroidaceae bacterium]|nr:TPM domain-containing protein [Bacteroidaceae bacterium]
MKRLYILIFGILNLLTLSVSAQKWTPETLPMVHLQDARKYVCNPDQVLHPATVDSVDALLFALERDKGVETVVVVVKSIEGDDPYEFGMQLGRKYGVGSKKQNTGLIVMLCTEDRSYQILTGQGLEGTIPDAIARRVQNRVMVPLLKQKQWDAAIYETMKALDGIIRGDVSISKDEAEELDSQAILIGGLLVLLGAGVMFALIISAATRVCPKCGQKSYRVVNRTQLKKGSALYMRSHWKCKKCGYEEDEDQHIGNYQSGTGGSVPPFIFPMGGGGRSGGFGGGFGGGSFGGGSFGGGGSGGRF